MALCSEVYPKLFEYLTSKKGVETDFVESCNWRRVTVGGKLFAAICADGTENAVLCVKAPADYNETVRQLHSDINESSYNYKSKWNEIRLTGSVPYEVVADMCDRGYHQTLYRLPKKLRNDILEEYL